MPSQAVTRSCFNIGGKARPKTLHICCSILPGKSPPSWLFWKPASKNRHSTLLLLLHPGLNQETQQNSKKENHALARWHQPMITPQGSNVLSPNSHPNRTTSILRSSLANTAEDKSKYLYLHMH